MAIEERLVKPGSWNITLLQEAPPGELEAIILGTPDRAKPDRGFLGHVLILPTHVPTIGRSDTNMLSMASYTGVLERISGGRGNPYSLSGGDVSRWLDYQKITTPLQIDEPGGTFVQWVTAIIGSMSPASLVIGTVTEPPTPVGGPLTWGTVGENLMMSHREALDFVCLWFNAEYRVNPDATVDAGSANILFPTNPLLSINEHFHRADAAVLGTAPTGQSWTSSVGTWSLVDNVAKLTTSTSHGLARIDTGATDYILNVGIHTSSALAGTEVGIPFRIEDSSNYLLLHVGDGANRRVILQKRVAGTYSNLVVSDTDMWTPVPDADPLLAVRPRLRFTIQALKSHIRIFLNDVLIIDYTCTAAEQTQFGDETEVGLWTDGPVDDGGASFLSLEVDDLSQRPTALASRKTGGNDPNIHGLSTTGLAIEEDIEDYSTMVVVTVSDSAAGTLPAGTAEVVPDTPYRDLFGNLVRKVKAQEAPTPPGFDEAVPAQAFADELVTKEGEIRRQLKLDSNDFNITATAKPGDMVYAFDAELGLVDVMNQVRYRGEVIYPIMKRLFAITWPVMRGMGVYFRDRNGLYTDLTPWVQWEDVGATTDTAETAERLTETEKNIQILEIFDRTNIV